MKIIRIIISVLFITSLQVYPNAFDKLKIEKLGIDWLNKSYGEFYDWELYSINNYRGYYKINGISKLVNGIEGNFLCNVLSSKISLFIYKNQVINIIKKPTNYNFIENVSWFPENLIYKAESYLKKSFHKLELDTLSKLKVINYNYEYLYKKAFEAGWLLGYNDPIYNYSIPYYLSNSQNNYTIKIWLDGINHGYSSGYNALTKYYKSQLETGNKYWKNSDSIIKETDAIIAGISNCLKNKKHNNIYYFLEFRSDINKKLTHNIYKEIKNNNYIYSKKIFPITDSEWKEYKRQMGYAKNQPIPALIHNVLGFRYKFKGKPIVTMQLYEKKEYHEYKKVRKLIHKTNHRRGEKLIISNLKWISNNTISFELIIDHQKYPHTYELEYKYYKVTNKWHQYRSKVISNPS